MISSKVKHKSKLLKWLASPAATILEVPPEQVQKLSDLLEGPSPSAQELTIRSAAEAAEMLEVYEGVYRDLCNRAAHPSLTSLRRHVTLNADNRIDGLRFERAAPYSDRGRQALSSSGGVLS